MTNKERNIIKKKIIKCLTEEFKRNEPIFDRKTGTAIYVHTDMFMIMEKIVKGLELAKKEIKQLNHG